MKKKWIIQLSVLLIGFLFVLSYQRVFAEEDESTYINGYQFRRIRQEISLNDKKYLAVSTDTHLYLFFNEEVKYTFRLKNDAIFIDKIEDVNGNGFDEIVIMTKDEKEDNILLYDSKDQSLLYSYASKMKAYNTGEDEDKPFGYYDQNVFVEDYRIEGHLLYAVAGYNAFLLDLKNEKEVWQYEAKDNLWNIELIEDINQDNTTDVLVSLQPEKVIALSGMNGKIIYSKKITTPLIDKAFDATYPTSIWSLQYNAQEKVVFAASENGKVYKLSALDGEILAQNTITEIKDFHIDADRVNRNSTNFKRFRIELTNDLTEDGINDLIYYQNLKPHDYLHSSYQDNSDFKIIFIDGASLTRLEEEITLRENIYGVNYLKGTYLNEDVFFIYKNSLESSANYQIFSITNQTYLTDELQIKKTSDSDNLTSLYIVEKDNYVIFSNMYLGFQKGDLDVNMIFMIKAEDYKIDKDHVLISQGIDASSGLINLKMRDLNTNQFIWQYDLGNNAVHQSIQIDFTHDYNQDGYKDIVLIKPYGSEKLQETPWVLLLDGATGSEISKVNLLIEENNESNYEQSLLTRFDGYNDVNSDGMNEYYAANNFGDLFIVDFKNNTLHNYFTDLEALSESPHYVEIDFISVNRISDIDEDGYDDFVQIKSSGDSNVKFNLIKTNHLAFVLEEKANYQQAAYNYEYNFGDMDGDGMDDLAFTTISHKSRHAVFHVISSKTGEVLVELTGSDQDHFYLSNLDVNQDGLKELFHIRVDFERYESNIVLYDISQDTPQTLFTSASYEPSYGGFYITPALLFQDGENTLIALNTKNYTWANRIDIYNLDSEKVDTIVLDRGRERKNYLSLDDFGIVLDEDKIYFYSANHGLYQSNAHGVTDKFYVYDYHAKKVLFYNNGAEINDLYIKGNHIILKDTYQQVKEWWMGQSIRFANLEENQKINKNFNVQFKNKNEGQVYIYVDNELVGITDKDHYNLELLEGKHEITISQINIDGIETVDVVNVTVVKNYTTMSIVLIVTVLAFASVVVLPRRKRRYPLPQEEIKGSDEVC